MSYIFISHVEEDAALAVSVASGLEAAGYKAWYYERDSFPGPSYLSQIMEAITDSLAVVVVVSRDAIGSWQVDKEVIQAHEANKPFVPLMKGITHAEFRARRPDWAMAMGAATSVPLSSDDASAVLPRIVEGLKRMHVRPGAPLPIDSDTAVSIPPTSVDDSTAPAATTATATLTQSAPATDSRAAPTVASTPASATPGGRALPRRFGLLAGLIGAVPVLAVVGIVAAHALTSGGPTVLLRDNFNNPAAGTLPKVSLEPKEYSLGYVDGEYFVRRVDPKLPATAAIQLPGSYVDTETTIDARLRGATAGRYIFLSCRSSVDWLDGYQLLVIPAGGWVYLERLQRGASKALYENQPGMVHGGNAWNHIDLICARDAITVRVNGATVTTAHDSALSSGKIGLGVAVGVGQSLTAEARFDNLVVTQK